DDVALVVIWMTRLLDAPESEAPRRRVERLQGEPRAGRRVDAVVQVPNLDLALSGVRYRRFDDAEVGRLWHSLRPRSEVHFSASHWHHEPPVLSSSVRLDRGGARKLLAPT